MKYFTYLDHSMIPATSSKSSWHLILGISDSELGITLALRRKSSKSSLLLKSCCDNELNLEKLSFFGGGIGTGLR